MKEFIPLEDDWSLIEAFFGQHLVPYRPGMACAHQWPGQFGEADPERLARCQVTEERNLFAPPSQVGLSAL